MLSLVYLGDKQRNIKECNEELWTENNNAPLLCISVVVKLKLFASWQTESGLLSCVVMLAIIFQIVMFQLVINGINVIWIDLSKSVNRYLENIDNQI